MSWHRLTGTLIVLALALCSTSALSEDKNNEVVANGDPDAPLEPFLRLTGDRAIAVVKFSSDGTKVAVIAGNGLFEDDVLRVWSIPDGELLVEHAIETADTGISDIAFSQSGDRLALLVIFQLVDAAVIESSRVEVLDISSGRILQRSPWYVGTGLSVTYGWNDHWIIAGGQRFHPGVDCGQLKIWEADSLREVATIRSANRASRRNPVTGHGSRLQSEDGEVLTGLVSCVSIDSDGNTIAAGVSSRFGGKVDLISTTTWSRIVSVGTFKNPPRRVRFSPDAASLLVREDRRAYAVDTSVVEQTSLVEAEEFALDISEDGRAIAVLAGTNIIVRDARTATPLARIKLDQQVRLTTLSPSSQRLAVVSKDNMLSIWALEPAKSAVAENRVGPAAANATFESRFRTARRLQSQGNLTEARRLYEELFETIDDKAEQSQANVHLEYAHVLLELGILGQAEIHVEQAIATYAALQSHVDVIRSKKLLVDIYIARGELVKARAAVTDAIRVRSFLSPRDKSAADTELVEMISEFAWQSVLLADAMQDIFPDTKRLEIALAEHMVLDLLKSAEALGPNATITSTKGRIALHQGDRRRASALAEKAAAQAISLDAPATDAIIPAEICVLRADCDWAAGEVESALEMYEEAVRLFRAKYGPAHSKTIASRFALAQLKALNGRSSEARNELKDVLKQLRHHLLTQIADMDHLHQLSYTSRTAQPIVDTVFSLALANEDDEAWVELVAECAINFKALSLIGERSRVRALRASEATGKDTTPGKSGASDGLSSPWVSLAEVQSRLRPEQVLLDVCRVCIVDQKRTEASYFGSTGSPSEHVYAAVVIPPIGEQSAVVRVGSATAIDAEVMQLRGGLRTSGADVKAISVRLAPLFDRFCNQKKSVLISPDSALWQVPWEALAMPTGAYALETWEISYLHTAHDLIRRMSVPLAPVKTAVVFVADSDSPDDLLALPHARREAMAARITLKKSLEADVDMPTRWNEVENMRSPGIALLIAHGFFDGIDESEQLLRRHAGPGALRTPSHYASIAPPPLEVVAALTDTTLTDPLLRCGIVFPSASGSAVRRNGRQLSQLDFRGTQMVVLSGCESAVGRVDPLMGPLSLREAFHIAGAQTVVGALWQVPDKESADLMERFWAHVAEGESPAAALRNAKLAIINQLRIAGKPPEPFVWAGFTATGDGRLSVSRVSRSKDAVVSPAPRSAKVTMFPRWPAIAVSLGIALLVWLTFRNRS